MTSARIGLPFLAAVTCWVACGGGSGETTSGLGGSASSSESASATTSTTASSSVVSSSSSSGGVQNPPAWLAGHPVGEWFEIPGTAGANGAAVDAFSGMALKDSTSEIIIAAAGGHGDSSDNSVVSLVLAADAPVWVTRKASSMSPQQNVPYYPDGTPASRHTYQSTHVIESLDRVFLFGARFVYGAAYEFPTVDAFNLTTNEWDPEGTWASVPSGGGYGAVRVRATEDVFTYGLRKWTAKDQTWSQPFTTLTNDSVRWPIAHDAKRDQLFALQWGDGQGYDAPKVNASRFPLSGAAQISVKIGDSAAYTQFQADAPTYAAMDYDPDNDRFLFYCGQGAGAGRVYVVTPNATDTWDMSILALGPGSITPAEVPGSGVNNRFRYVPALKGFVLLANHTANLYFLRTS
ncbi:MAG: hypothetical protein QM820_06635 [Minicystis sp.]